MEESITCNECGKSITGDYKFCSACGAVINDDHDPISPYDTSTIDQHKHMNTNGPSQTKLDKFGGSMASIICVVTGILALIVALFALITVTIGSSGNHVYFTTICLAVFAYQGFLGTLAVIGGIQASKRKRWGLALAGAFCSTFILVPMGLIPAIFGIIAIMQIMQSKEQFRDAG